MAVADFSGICPSGSVKRRDGGTECGVRAALPEHPLPSNNYPTGPRFHDDLA